MRKILLRRGNAAIVDDEDFEWLTQWEWSLMRGAKHLPYAVRYPARGEPRKPGAILMHRAILQPPFGLHVDHIDGNGLNNVRANIRLATPSLNQRNRHRHRRRKYDLPMGVDPQSDASTFRASYKKHYKRYHLGSFATPEAAHAAYLAARADSIAEAELEVNRILANHE